MTPKNEPLLRDAEPANQTTGIRALANRVMQPVALTPPEVAPQLTRLGPVERAGEVMRYTALRTEFWLSPRGTLREWLRLVLRVAVFLAIPALLLSPVITFLLGSAVAWSAILADIARNLAIVPAWLATALLGVLGILLLLRLLTRR